MHSKIKLMPTITLIALLTTPINWCSKQDGKHPYHIHNLADDKRAHYAHVLALEKAKQEQQKIKERNAKIIANRDLIMAPRGKSIAQAGINTPEKKIPWWHIHSCCILPQEHN